MIVLRKSVANGRDHSRSGGLGSGNALVESLLPLSAIDVALTSKDFHG